MDVNDLSRWVVRFTSDYPSDLPEDRAEYSFQTLKEMRLQSNMFTITMPYYPIYEEKAEQDIDFTLEPKTELFYIDDDGRMVKIENISLEKEYYFMKDMLTEYDDRDGNWHHIQRIFYRGTYRIDYVFSSDLSNTGILENLIELIHIKIIVKKSGEGLI